MTTFERPADEQRGEQNELGYRNTNEERAYDEAGTQGEEDTDVAREDDDQLEG